MGEEQEQVFTVSSSLPSPNSSFALAESFIRRSLSAVVVTHCPVYSLWRWCRLCGHRLRLLDRRLISYVANTASALKDSTRDDKVVGDQSARSVNIVEEKEGIDESENNEN